MLRSRAWIPGLLATILISCATGAPDAPDEGNHVTVIKPDGADVSLPLTELAKIPVPEAFGLRAHEAEPARPIPHMRAQSTAQLPDPVVQSSLVAGPNIPTPTTTFEGMGVGLAGFTVQSAPPDTDGDVGPNHYVQIVNSSTTIFNKQGTKLLGPVLTKTFFANFAAGTACQNTNDGDGVVRYDRLADRWVISQFSVNGGNGPFFQCIAVSTSPDPTGTYTRYQFSFNAFNDYPKMGLWPDAYYFTYNLFPNNVFGGARVCAVDRVKMIAGNLNATQQCFDTGVNFGGLLASDLDGPTPPPVGEPNLLVALDTTALDFFKFHVDFTTPANSTFSGANPTQIPVAAFTPLCNGGTCVKQPGTTQQLDSLADRLMNRFVYRNFGDHEALLVSHAVTAGTGGGVRFYELRLNGACTATSCATPTIFQQGTFAPDASFRWMSSMAFDQVGNIAMGYSTASSTINPSIRYTGRLTTDALGTMGQGEATLVAGTGSQTGNNLSRWGDYSSMNIDPSDDCTYWFTSEYMGASGSFNWHTRIGNFKFANCGVVNDFSITANPASQTVADGSSTTYTINTARVSGTAETIALTVAGLPAGVTGTFNPTSVTAGGSSTLTVTVPAGTAASTSTLTITGTAPSKTHSTTVSLTITNNVNQAPTVTFTSPTNGQTVSGTITVSANATDADGTVASVRFDLPDGTSVTDTTAPFSTTFDTTKVADGSGVVFTATATDDKGATATTSVTVTVANNNQNQAPTVTFTSPTNGQTVSGTITVSANATDADGTVASVKFTLPDGTTVTDTTAPFSTTFDTTKVADGSRVFTAVATDNQGATATTSVTVTVANNNNQCLDNTFTATDVPKAIPDNNATGITSTVPVVGHGTVAAFTLSLNITHTFRGDLLVTLTSPAGLTATVFNGVANDATDNLILVNASSTVFNGQVAAGNWKLKVVDRAAQDVGTLNSWSFHIVGNCFSGSAAPNLPTVDNSTVCTSLNVATTGGVSASAQLDFSGNHDFCSSLSGTLAHNGKTVTAFARGQLNVNGPCTFNVTNHAVPGLTGDASGTWTFCITDNDAGGDTGRLNTWAVHN